MKVFTHSSNLLLEMITIYFKMFLLVHRWVVLSLHIGRS